MAEVALPATDGTLTVQTAPEEIAPDLFAVQGIINFMPGVKTPVRMTIIRLPGPSRRLVVYSPFNPTLVDISALGNVHAIVAPNPVHWAYAQKFQAAHPAATLYSSPSLAARFPDRDWGTVLGVDTPEEVLAPELQLRVLSAWTFFSEVVLFHAPTKSLITADLGFNFTPAVLATSPFGFRLFVLTSRAARPLDWSVTVKLIARSGCKDGVKQLDNVLELDWDRFVPGHGEVVDSGAKDVFRHGVYRYVSDVAAGRDWMVFKATAIFGGLVAAAVGIIVLQWRGIKGS